MEIKFPMKINTLQFPVGAAAAVPNAFSSGKCNVACHGSKNKQPSDSVLVALSVGSSPVGIWISEAKYCCHC